MVGKGFLRVFGVWEFCREVLKVLRVIKVLQELIGRVFIEGRRTVPDVSVTYGILHRWMSFRRSTAGVLLLKNILKN